LSAFVPVEPTDYFRLGHVFNSLYD